MEKRHGTPDLTGNRAAVAELRRAIAQEQIWLMDERYLRAMLADPAAVLFAEREIEAARPDNGKRQQAGGVAVLSITGPIFYRGAWWHTYYGLSNVMGLQAAIREAVADPAIKAIVMEIDSPGGTVPGVSELAAEIVAARAKKKIVAVANPRAASAAYWIASAAGDLVMLPSGEVGSIGVWAGHVDYSKALEQEGVKITLISAGKYKVEGNPYEPLGEEAQAAIQQEVDDVYAQFLADVAKARGKTVAEVKANFGEGRMVTAKRALEVGMVDAVATVEQVVSRLMSASSFRTTAAARERELQILEV